MKDLLAILRINFSFAKSVKFTFLISNTFFTLFEIVIQERFQLCVCGVLLLLNINRIPAKICSIQCTDRNKSGKN